MEKIITLIILAAVILFGAYSWHKLTVTPTSSPQAAELSKNEVPVAKLSEENTSTFPTLGNLQAPVTIVEYGHFQCPYCNRFFRETEPQINEKYIQAGKVKFVWKDFAYEGEGSKRAAEAAYCAEDQGKFWEYHNVLFSYIWDNYFSKGINGEEANVFTAGTLGKLATDMGLEESKFNECLSSGKYTERVKKNFDEGVALGVKGTPTFFINGQKIVGAQPFSVFSQIIESELKK